MVCCFIITFVNSYRWQVPKLESTSDNLSSSSTDEGDSKKADQLHDDQVREGELEGQAGLEEETEEDEEEQ